MYLLSYPLTLPLSQSTKPMLGKETLLESIAGKNRGVLATEQDRQAILGAIAQLEDRNPTPRPLEAGDKLQGNWRLLYTSSQELLGIDRFPLLSLGQVYQYISVPDAMIYNVAEVNGLPYLEGLVSVVARFEVVSERRVDVKFERLILGAQRLIGYRACEDYIEQIRAGQRFAALDLRLNPQNQQGWLEITYLDDDLRIGRGNEGNVFVLTRVR